MRQLTSALSSTKPRGKQLLAFLLLCSLYLNEYLCCCCSSSSPSASLSCSQSPFVGFGIHLLLGHQVVSPMICNTAGRNTVRTMNVSNKTAKKSIEPNSNRTEVEENIKPANAMDMITLVGETHAKKQRERRRERNQ